MKRLLILFACVLVCLLSGFIAGRLQTDALVSWYPLLNKSPLTPPNIAFPIAWSLLYIAMGLSLGLILATPGPRKPFFIALFALQLFLNFIWSIAFFACQSPLSAFVIILLLIAAIVYYALRAYGSYRTSALLFVPYILWVVFAAYLNLYIVLNN